MAGSGPSISVVVVCDYDAGRQGGWADIRKTLTALAVQDIAEPAEFILCESEEFRGEMPDDFIRILPDLKILFAPCQSAYELKKVGVRAASSEFVAMLDADCLPHRDWLRRLLDSLRRHPEAAAVSGKTFYGGESIWVRTCALLSRAYVNPGGDGPTRFVSDNNAGYRRSAYLAHPIPTDMGNFAAHLQSNGLLRLGYVLWFDPEIEAEHDFEGWSMERDVRRHRGYSVVRTRMLDGSLPYAWLVRLGPAAVAPILAGKIVSSWWDCIRCRRAFGLRWHELPVALTAAVGINMLELPGMWAAFRGRKFGKTCFR